MLQLQPGQELFPEGQTRGRITIYCIAETLNRDLLSKKLRDRGPNFQLQVGALLLEKFNNSFLEVPAALRAAQLASDS